MDMLAQNWERRGVALCRMVIGVMWITQLAWKVPPMFGCTPDFAISTDYAHRTAGLCDWTGLIGRYSILPLQGALFTNFVGPNLSWMGWGVFLLELAIAASMLLGVLVRLGSALGLLQSLNLLIGLSAAPNEWYWTYGMMVVLSLIFFFTAAGRTWGLDAVLIPRLLPRAERGAGLPRLLLKLM
jgi:thiosulfate dehydrogenase (quinone) large subunit